MSPINDLFCRIANIKRLQSVYNYATGIAMATSADCDIWVIPGSVTAVCKEDSASIVIAAAELRQRGQLFRPVVNH